jgi:hypothetical protein
VDFKQMTNFNNLIFDNRIFRHGIVDISYEYLGVIYRFASKECEISCYGVIQQE